MRILVTILAVLAALVGLVLIGVYSGAYDVAADEPESGVTRWLMETVQKQSVSAAADGLEAPSLTDRSRIETGAHHYGAMCETCHGGPGAEPSEIGQGLNPEPPELSHAVHEWEPAEMFWMVKHGIKMTGMPAFGATHGDDEIWSIVAFVRQLPEMSPAEYRAQTAGAAGGHGHGGEEHHGAQAGEEPEQAEDRHGGDPSGGHEPEGHEHGGSGSSAPVR